MRQRISAWWIDRVLREVAYQAWLIPFGAGFAVFWSLMASWQFSLGHTGLAWLALIDVIVWLGLSLITFERRELRDMIRGQRSQTTNLQ